MKADAEPKLLYMDKMPSSCSASIQILQITGDDVLIGYQTDENNKPKTFGNRIFVWQTTKNAVPWDKDPAADVAIDSDESTGTQILSFNFKMGSSYIIGYSVGTSKNTVCTTAYIPSEGWNDLTKCEYESTEVKINHIGGDRVTVKCSKLPNYFRSINKDWIGIWRSDSVPYGNIKPMNDPLTVLSDDPTTIASIGNIAIVPGATYSVGYFLSDDKKNDKGEVVKAMCRSCLVASTTFTTSS